MRAGMAGRLLLAFPHVHFAYRLSWNNSVSFFWTNGPTAQRVRDMLEENGYSNGVVLCRDVVRRRRHLRLVR